MLLGFTCSSCAPVDRISILGMSAEGQARSVAVMLRGRRMAPDGSAADAARSERVALPGGRALSSEAPGGIEELGGSGAARFRLRRPAVALCMSSARGSRHLTAGAPGAAENHRNGRAADPWRSRRCRSWLTHKRQHRRWPWQDVQLQHSCCFPVLSINQTPHVRLDLPPHPRDHASDDVAVDGFEAHDLFDERLHRDLVRWEEGPGGLAVHLGQSILDPQDARLAPVDLL
mmetsp:Transcript_22472/g.72772  ORF Transcript_22472/g.72772 Transcript_22472/m.72772 type:complete len:231 (-) Transcript_22472:2602-3294(-)